MTRFLVEYWYFIVWAVAVAAARAYGGWRLAFAVGTFGLGAVAYRKGRSDANKEHGRRAADIERRREEAYSEIDRRGMSRDDVADRLRRGNY